MTRPGSGRFDELLPVLLIASAVTAVVALYVLYQRIPAETWVLSKHEAPAVELISAPSEPIHSEADVFLTGPWMLAIDPDSGRKRDAHPRTLKRWQFLRAYPGAPPRIPHGFTADEFRTGFCKTCHERGGYSPRFGSYVPVTPHPSMGACLQCHVGLDEITGVSLPDTDPNTRCRQCHASPGATASTMRTLPGWEALAWPTLATKTPNRGPTPIPHDLQFRGNCLACHSGPSAVAEIRTTHPDWINCRQCHVTVDPDAGSFVRPPPGVTDIPGDAS